MLWRFRSDDDATTNAGPFIDNLEVWDYQEPTLTCGDHDPGYKGLVVEPYERSGAQEVPVIRPGETTNLDKLVKADVRWVRMVFEQQGGIVRRIDYDRMVDSLCAQGISVVDILNDQTLKRQDKNNPDTALSYRGEFARTAGELAYHFRGRVSHWEVWNEPNLGSHDPTNPAYPYISPALYAPVLKAASQAIKANN